MSSNLIVSLIYNISLLLALSIVFTLVPTKALQFKGTYKIIVGVIMGLVGIGIMYSPFELASGVVFDSRSILTSVCGMFFGLVPTVITVAITGFYRFSQGGIGAIPGLTQIVLTGAMGLLWRYWRLDLLIKNKRKRWYELYILGILTHIVVLLTVAMMPKDIALNAYKSIALPMITMFPIGTVILGSILFSQIDIKNTFNKLEESEERLNVTLLSVGDGVITTDKEGRITLINKVAEQITGWTLQEVMGKNIREVLVLVNEFTKTRADDPVRRVLNAGKIIGLASHTEVLCKDGQYKPIADSAAPIRDKEGKILGVVLVIRDITEERNRQKQINYLAFHDSLTGLFNRSFFEKEMERLDVKRKLPLSIVIADVNGLKLVNDAFGHNMGDKLLKEMATAIKAACREEDIVTRWGGDEFIVLLPNTDVKATTQISRRIMQNCAKVEMPYVECSISLGSDTKSSTTQDIKHVIKNAEDYMYRMKSMEGSSIRGTTINAILYTFLEKNPREQLHSSRVSKLCKQIGEAMGLPENEVNELGVIGLMHDIGKIAISESILNKDEALNKADWEEIRRHPEIGYRILSSSNNTAYIADHVLKHHERLDGLGYPNGIKGDQIPLQTRILAIADAYDAMTSERPYKETVSEKSAVENLKEHSGTHYDKEIVDIFIKKVLKKEKNKS